MSLLLQGDLWTSSSSHHKSTHRDDPCRGKCGPPQEAWLASLHVRTMYLKSGLVSCQPEQRWWRHEQKSWRWLWGHAERTRRTWRRWFQRKGSRWSRRRQATAVSRGTWCPVRRLQCQGMLSWEWSAHYKLTITSICLLLPNFIPFILSDGHQLRNEALPRPPLSLCTEGLLLKWCRIFYTWLSPDVIEIIGPTSSFKCSESVFLPVFYLFFLFFSYFFFSDESGCGCRLMWLFPVLTSTVK